MHRAIMDQVRGLQIPALPTPRRRLGVGLAASAALFLTGMGLVSFTDRPTPNLLERAPIEAARSTGFDRHSLLVTVGHRSSWQGLMGRRKALGKLMLENGFRRR
jgi:hypothetical protein